MSVRGPLSRYSVAGVQLHRNAAEAGSWRTADGRFVFQRVEITHTCESAHPTFGGESYCWGDTEHTIKKWQVTDTHTGELAYDSETFESLTKAVEFITRNHKSQ